MKKIHPKFPFNSNHDDLGFQSAFNLVVAGSGTVYRNISKRKCELDIRRWESLPSAW
jgi:hypothetical protein